MKNDNEKTKNKKIVLKNGGFQNNRFVKNNRIKNGCLSFFKKQSFSKMIIFKNGRYSFSKSLKQVGRFENDCF